MDYRLTNLDDERIPCFRDLLNGKQLLGAAIEGVATPCTRSVVTSVVPRQTTWHPGVSMTVRYDVWVDRGEGAQRESFVASSDPVPGALQVSDGTSTVSIWRNEFDPLLPGLGVCMSPDGLADLLEPMTTARVRDVKMLAYRPGRRAVVRVRTDQHTLYLKLVRPGRARELHELHRQLSLTLPVPKGLGYSDELGVVVMPAMPGSTVRAAIADGQGPSVQQLLTLLDAIPDIALRPAASWRTAEFADLLMRLVPEAEHRLETLIHTLGNAESQATPADRTVHGDFHEAQLLTSGRSLTALLDVDTVRQGNRYEDPANMIGHLSVMALVSPNGGYRQYAQAMLDASDRQLDPAALRNRVASVVLGLATGPFRVLEDDWHRNTLSRIALAEQWMQSAERVGEKHLTPS